MPVDIGIGSTGPGGRASARAFIDANLDRMLWGFDWPHPRGRPGVAQNRDVEPFHSVNDGHALNRLAGWMRGSELVKVLQSNPAHLDFLT